MLGLPEDSILKNSVCLVWIVAAPLRGTVLGRHLCLTWHGTIPSAFWTAAPKLDLYTLPSKVQLSTNAKCWNHSLKSGLINVKQSCWKIAEPWNSVPLFRSLVTKTGLVRIAANNSFTLFVCNLLTFEEESWSLDCCIFCCSHHLWSITHSISSLSVIYQGPCVACLSKSFLFWECSVIWILLR